MASEAADAPPRPSDADLLARFRASRNRPASSRTVGFEVTLVDQAARRVEATFEAKGELFANPMGQVQGGYLCAMLDECMSVACMVASGMTHVAPTLEMKTSFLRAARPGALHGMGRVLRFGRTVAFTEGELYDADGRLLAKASGTALPTPFAAFK